MAVGGNAVRILVALRLRGPKTRGKRLNKREAKRSGAADEVEPLEMIRPV
jgi:hypothetical protein